MNASKTLYTLAAVSLLALAAGCSNTNWARMGSGNQTSYATGSYPMPAKAAPAPATAAAPDATVLAAQAALSRNGYDPGPQDGSMGPATHEAVTKFQQARGLPPTGELDSSTKAALGIQQQ